MDKLKKLKVRTPTAIPTEYIINSMIENFILNKKILKIASKNKEIKEHNILLIKTFIKI